MNFTLRVKNPPAGAAWWGTTWYVPPEQWNSPWLGISTTSYEFSAVGTGPGYLYVDAYDAGYVRITDGASRGAITPAQGSVWEYDFAAGTLTEVTGAPPPAAGEARAAIVSISAPGEAAAGDTVQVTVTLKNTGDAAGWLGSAADPVYQWTERWVEPGATTVISGSFAMPTSDVDITAWAYHYDGTSWVFDQEKVATVRLVTLPGPEYRDLGATFSMEATFG